MNCYGTTIIPFMILTDKFSASWSAYCPYLKTHDSIRSIEPYSFSQIYCEYGCCGTTFHRYCCAYHLPTAAILAITVGLVTILTLCIAVCCCCIGRRQNQRTTIIRAHNATLATNEISVISSSGRGCLSPMAYVDPSSMTGCDLVSPVPLAAFQSADSILNNEQHYITAPPAYKELPPSYDEITKDQTK